MKSIRLLERADLELTAAAEYYESERTGIGRKFEAKVWQAAMQVGQFPGSGTALRNGFRRMLVPGFPFALIYRDEPEACLIVAIAHAKRRPDYWQER